MLIRVIGSSACQIFRQCFYNASLPGGLYNLVSQPRPFFLRTTHQ